MSESQQNTILFDGSIAERILLDDPTLIVNLSISQGTIRICDMEEPGVYKHYVCRNIKWSEEFEDEVFCKSVSIRLDRLKQL